MATLTDPDADRTSLPIIVLAGLAVLTIQSLVDAGLPMLPITKVMRVLGVARQRAYEMADHIREAIRHLPQPLGRPPRGSDEPSSQAAEHRYAICASVRTYLAEHPGAHVARTQRDGFSPGFRTFVLRLWRQHADELPLAIFADAVGVAAETLRDWIGGCRANDSRRPDETDSDEDASILPEGVIEQDETDSDEDASILPEGVIEQIVTNSTSSTSARSSCAFVTRTSSSTASSTETTGSARRTNPMPTPRSS